MAQVAAMRKKTSAQRSVQVFGDYKILVGTLTISSYVNAGGEALDLTTAFPNLATKQPDMIWFQNTSGRTFYYDPATKKVSAFVAAGTEVANATNIGAVNFVAFLPA